LKIGNGSRAALVVFDLNDKKFTLKPFYNQRTETVSSIVKEHNALVGINGGFFNLSNGESTSYVIIDGKNQCEPKENKALIENPALKPYLETIFNRSELRILEDSNNKRKASINKHNDPVPDGWTLVYSLQAGPALLPKITDSEEAFTRQSADGKLIDSIGSQTKAARTAIGITNDNHILLLCIANKNQDAFSSGATLEEVSIILQQLGCTKAINLDGGTSTTMVITEGNRRNDSSCSMYKVIAGEPEKHVKSGWIIEKSSNQSNSTYSFPR
jgi:exopolysaccharide biosynthesis protein